MCRKHTRSQACDNVCFLYAFSEVYAALGVTTEKNRAARGSFGAEPDKSGRGHRTVDKCNIWIGNV